MPSKLVLLLPILFLSTGCTLAGALVGGGVDAVTPGPYEIRSATAHVRLERRERVKIWLATGELVQGRYLGSVAPTPRDPETYLVIDADPQPRLVAVSELKTLGVEVSGKGWVYGALIGLAVDVTFVVAAIVSLSQMDYSPYGSGWNGDSGCFC